MATIPLELLVWLPISWRWRKNYGLVALVVTAVLSGLAVGVYPSLWTGIILVISGYRLFNLQRSRVSKVYPVYLYKTTLRTALLLMVAQLVIALLLLINLSGNVVEMGIAVFQLLLGIVLLCSTIRHIRTTRTPIISSAVTDHDLPTLTVAIPARNETVELERCLQSLLANDYPKLEILVLDDCSQVARTPEIIRSFAHDGVRFIAGEEPPASWLAKNYAYEQLSREANGELLLFCGVDIVFEPTTLRTLVLTLQQKHKSMLSVLPQNTSMHDTRARLLQPMRYAWELALPRRFFDRPPVLSSCWLITADLLKRAGGFKSVSHSVVPESFFAKAAIPHDGYSFIRSSQVTSDKAGADQLDTAIRTRYPQLHRRPELVAVVTFIEVLGLMGSPIFFIAALFSAQWLILLLSGLASLAVGCGYALLLRAMYHQRVLKSLALYLLAVLYDVYVQHVSMEKYEFGEVLWKGRNICLPVMQVTASLPKLPE